MVEIITVNGAELAYELSGPENAQLIITLHGGRGMGKTLVPLKKYKFSNQLRGSQVRLQSLQSPERPFPCPLI
jgi:hypothetical protein